MKLKEFREVLIGELSKALEGGVIISAYDAMKHNNIMAHGIKFMGTSNQSPVLNIEPYYHRFKRGEISMDYIVNDCVHIYNNSRVITDFDIKSILDWSAISNNLFCSIVNTEMSSELLKSVPHREMLDLSIIYRLRLKSPLKDGMFANTIVTNVMLEEWGVDEEQLFMAAKSNNDEDFQFKVENIIDLLKDKGLLEDCSDVKADEVKLYVISNNMATYGANAILHKALFKTVSDIFNDDLFILPSSINELIVLPVGYADDTEVGRLVEMVKEVNNTQVAPEDLLSYNVYKYSAKDGEIMIA